MQGKVLGAQRHKESGPTTSVFRKLQQYSGREAGPRPCKTQVGCRDATQEAGHCSTSSTGHITK